MEYEEALEILDEQRQYEAEEWRTLRDFFADLDGENRVEQVKEALNRQLYKEPCESPRDLQIVSFREALNDDYEITGGERVEEDCEIDQAIYPNT
jgi:hypothetical protein